MARYRPGPGGRGDGRHDGRIDLRNGQSTIRININERTSMEIRMRLMEEAVRDLQAQVYDLRDEPTTRVVSSYVCTMNTTFYGSYIGKAGTEIEATANARNSCIRGGREMFCSSNRVLCSRQDQVITY